MPIIRKVNSKANVRRASSNDSPINVSQPVLNRYEATSTAAQTVINLSFSVDQALTDLFLLYVDGKLLRLGAGNDYTFTSIDANNFSSQVTLTQSLSVNLNILAYKLGLKKESEFGTDNRIVTINNTLALFNLVPQAQSFLSSSGTYNATIGFVVTSANATSGATYTNNSVTYTVAATISGATILYARGSGNPTTSGVLTKTAGTGDSTINFSTFSAPKWIRVRCRGGGGQGGSSGTTGGTNGGAGSATTFAGGAISMSAGGGGGGPTTNGGGWGGVGSSPATGGDLNLPGVTSISMIGNNNTGTGNTYGGSGAGEGAGSGGSNGPGPGANATVNTGGGGGGAGSWGASAVSGCPGGAQGAYCEKIINIPALTYSWAVGVGGSGGVAGTSGAVGGNGGSGYILVEEYYK